MTVSTTTNKVVCLGDGANKTFTYSFLIPTATDAQVVYTDAAGTQTTLSSAQYSITGLGSSSGGIVTYPLGGGSAIASGTTLTIYRSLAITQPTSISNQGGFYPQVVEAAIDRAVMEIQQVNELLGRTLTSPISDATAIGPLPSAAERANKGLLFDASGNPMAGTLAASGAISSAMQPVVSAASIPAGRTELGLGSLSTTNIGAGLQADGAGGVRVSSPIVTKTANYSVLISDHGNRYAVVGPITFTLPASSTLWNGFEITVDVLNDVLTIALDGADTAYGGVAGESVYVPVGYTAVIFTTGAGNWYIKKTKQLYCQSTPGGYLSTVSDNIMYGGDIDSTSIFYLTYAHTFIPVFNGFEWIDFPFYNLDCALNASQQLSSSAHDVFVSIVGGEPTLVIGPAWSTVNSRGTGAGTTELTRAGYGLNTNKYQMTAYNGSTPYTIKAARGTYVGSILTSTAGHVSCYTTLGQARKWGVWNAYNRKTITLSESDPTASWSYATAAWRASNNNSANYCLAFTGLQEEQLVCSMIQRVTATFNSGDNGGAYGIGYGSTSTPSGVQGRNYNTATTSALCGGAHYVTTTFPLGATTIYALEYYMNGTVTYQGGENDMRLTVTYQG